MTYKSSVYCYRRDVNQRNLLADDKRVEKQTVTENVKYRHRSHTPMPMLYTDNNLHKSLQFASQHCQSITLTRRTQIHIHYHCLHLTLSTRHTQKKSRCYIVILQSINYITLHQNM